MKPLLIEIGLEELPAAPLIKELPNFIQKYKQALSNYGLDQEFSFDYTPRRLVFSHPASPAKQPDVCEELFGPPVESAFVDGKPTPAAIGFAKKCAVEIESLGTKEQKGRTVLYYQKFISGKELRWILSSMLEEFLRSLSFGKTMRWGDNSFEFIRPIRWLLVSYGNELIDCEVFGVRSALATFGHRTNGYEPVATTNTDNFEDFLMKRGVMLSHKKRRSKILEEFALIEKKNSGFTIEIDDDLLDEVVALTEYPTALLGEFDKSFLVLPKEVIITSMKTHQRYFPVFQNGKLSNHFVVVSNAQTDDFSLVIKGNEKVLRPRLSDALFFWQNDLANGLNSEPLKTVMYVQGLGSMHDKLIREVEICKRLLAFFGLQDEHLIRSAELSKADLTSQMVYEFTELQGVMGSYYALAQNEHPVVANAILEQYLPLGENSALPSTQAGALLSIATKIDALMALFSVGHVPSGSKDPLALRRAATSIIKIVIDRKLSFNLEALVSKLADLYKDFDKKSLVDFVYERAQNVLGCNSTILKAVLESGEKDILELSRKVEALVAIVNKQGFKEGFSTFKRVANILKDENLSAVKAPDRELFTQKEENALYEKFCEIDEKEYRALLEKLFALKPYLDSYFDGVMVNTPDQMLKANRIATINQIYQAFKAVADIKEISF